MRAVCMYGEALPLTLNDVEAWTDDGSPSDGKGQIHEATAGPR